MISFFQTDTPTERHLLGGVLVLMLGATLFLAWLGHAIHEDNRSLVQQIAQSEDAAQPYLDGNMAIPLPTLLAAEQRVHDSLQADWVALVDQVETFDEGMDLFSGQSSDSDDDSEEGRIDFKVALYNARTNLLEQASMQGITVPEDLGMRETIDADEPAETLLWQLATVVRFMERAIELGIPEIDAIKPLSPTVHVTADESVPFAREFPLRITMHCSFTELYQLVDALLTQGSYFALRRFDLEKSTPGGADNLLVNLVYASEVFDVLTLVEETEPPETPTQPPVQDPAVTNEWGEPW